VRDDLSHDPKPFLKGAIMVESWYNTIDKMSEEGCLNDVAGDQIFYFLCQMEKWQTPAPKVSVAPIVPSFEDGPQIDLEAVKVEWDGVDAQGGEWHVEMLLHASGVITNFVYSHFKINDEDVFVASHKVYPYTEGMVLLMRWLPVTMAKQR
jgi:hypothetical protein